MKWNPYFVAYAATNGRTCAAQVEHDREEYPGGSMVGFILWMNQRWAEWRELRGVPRTIPSAPLQGAPHGFWFHILSPSDHADFAGWLRGCAFRTAEGL